MRKTPPAQRAASRKRLAARKQALPDGSFPVPNLDYLRKAIRSVGRAPASRRPALKRLIVKRATQLKATSAPGVKGTWAFQAAGEPGSVIGLAGPKGYVHGWIYEGGAGLPSVADHNAALRGKGVTPPSRAHPALTREPPGAGKPAAPRATPAAGGKVKFAWRPGDVLITRRPPRTTQAGTSATARGQAHANDTEAIDLAAMTARRMPVVRGAADVQLSRTAPGQITAMHKSSGMKIGVITPSGHGYAGKHADGKATPPSGSQQGALAGLIAYHNQQAAKAKASGFPPAQQDGTASMPGSKSYTAGASAALDLAGAQPVSTPASSSSDGPRVTSMGAGAGKPAAAGSPSGLSPYAMALYRKFLAKKMKPAVALAFAKRADAMHDKAAGGAA